MVDCLDPSFNPAILVNKVMRVDALCDSIQPELDTMCHIPSVSKCVNGNLVASESQDRFKQIADQGKLHSHNSGHKNTVDAVTMNPEVIRFTHISGKEICHL